MYIHIHIYIYIYIILNILSLIITFPPLRHAWPLRLGERKRRPRPLVRDGPMGLVLVSAGTCIIHIYIYIYI